MATEKRWQEAQTHEKAFWEQAAAKIQSGASGLSWYKWRAENLMNMMAKAFPNDTPSFSNSRVLEIGCGAVGAVAFLDARERVAIDPLNDYYASRPELAEHRNSEVEYRKARGEQLEFADQSFDLVIMENVIDHVEKADAVMQEINRVLKPGAYFFMTVNLHPAWGAMLHNFVSAIGIDRRHPHTFTLDRVRKFLDTHGFEIKHEEWQNYGECRRADWKSRVTRDKLKAVSGLSEFLFTSVNVKKS